MAINLAALKARQAPLTFDFDGEQVHAAYYPHKLTPEYQSSLQRLAKAARNGTEETDDDEFDMDARTVSDLLASWDVIAGEDEQGQVIPFPPTYENLLTAPRALITRTALEILDDVGKLAMPKTLKN